METKKIILIACEGESDKIVLNSLTTYNELHNEDKSLRPEIRFINLHGDKLTLEYIDANKKHYPYTKADCLNQIRRIIEENFKTDLEPDGITLEDIERIFLVIDMDGAYVNNSDIIRESVTGPLFEKIDPTYTEHAIITNKVGAIINRNKRKRTNIEYLLNERQIELQVNKDKVIIPLSIFYMSCNIDHVTSNKMMMKGKSNAARRWSAAMTAPPSADMKLRNFFASLLPCTPSYQATWEYICKPKTFRSLSRASNCLLILNEVDALAESVTGGNE